MNRNIEKFESKKRSLIFSESLIFLHKSLIYTIVTFYSSIILNLNVRYQKNIHFKLMNFYLFECVFQTKKGPFFKFRKEFNSDLLENSYLLLFLISLTIFGKSAFLLFLVQPKLISKLRVFQTLVRIMCVSNKHMRKKCEFFDKYPKSLVEFYLHLLS